MDEPIEELYFNWLCAKILPRTDQNYIGLLRILHSTEFVWVVHQDRNRAEDGVELRESFLNETGFEIENSWFYEPCSVLEMLVALSFRAAFQTDDPRKDWFWEFLRNLGLDEYRYVEEEEAWAIADILEKFIWRIYDSDGSGGLFPLRDPREDQRKVEIWYQFSNYLVDQGRI